MDNMKDLLDKLSPRSSELLIQARLNQLLELDKHLPNLKVKTPEASLEK